ncbi:LD-carboxypeptidase [Paenibacillus sp. N1-5-1-14]|uniref:S66 peptidase family protein n=1 Tax=Paenibacillus radicibacter TaxID=2972488 RepID=UPI0021593CF8|nr:LD-carboxypeptidase [Paenibacillus radicibacter]MCR8645148.1 LD-carboxypeptidase [Paenibacillus radicibacter]
MAIKAPMLKPGDTIGIVTLGSPLDAQTINSRIEVLMQMGFKVKLGKHVYADNGFLASSALNRASDLMQMFADDEVTLILATRGGVGVSDILPYLDYAFIHDHPKIVSGFSDITALLQALYEYADLVCFNSLMLIDFRMTTPAYNFDQFFAATSTLQAPRLIQNPPEIPPTQSWIPGNVTGPIVGGNLTSFVGLLGTPFDVDTRGKILFLEETHEPVNTVYRYLSQLRLAGKFNDCIGIVMGECSNCEQAYGIDYGQLLYGFLMPLGKPLMTHLASSHGYFKASIPIGAIVNLNTYTNTLTVLETTVE